MHLYAARQSSPALTMVSVKEPDPYNLNSNRMRRTLKRGRRLAERSDEISSCLIYLLSKPRTANVIALRIGKLNDHRFSVDCWIEQ